MICPQCNIQAGDDANFCADCGTRVRGGGAPVVAAAPEQDEQGAAQLVIQARALLHQDSPEEALLAAQAAIALTPASADAHLALGEVFEREGRLEDAAGQYAVALGLDPTSVAASQRAGALRSQAAPAPPATASSLWGVATAAVLGIAVIAGGFALLASGGKKEGSAVAPAARPVGSSLPPTHFGTSTAPGATLAPAAAAPGAIKTGIHAAGPNGAAAAALSRPLSVPARPAGPAFPRTAPNQPVIRVGLPPVVNRPAAERVPALGPAVPRALEPAPLPPPASAVLQPSAHPQDRRGASPAPAAPPAAPAAEPTTAKKCTPGEPLEPDTGFIRIEPVRKADPGEPDASPGRSQGSTGSEGTTERGSSVQIQLGRR